MSKATITVKASRPEHRTTSSIDRLGRNPSDEVLIDITDAGMDLDVAASLLRSIADRLDGGKSPKVIFIPADISPTQAAEIADQARSAFR